MKKPEIGTIISGTLREEDLLEAFANELERLAETSEVIRNTLELAESVDRRRLIAEARQIDPSSSFAPAVVEELYEALNDLAPSYMYFGTLEGDGSDFGFWPDLEALKTSVYDGETLQVNDICNIPADYTGDIMIVNDHGNVTLGHVKEPGDDHITVWSCV